MDSFNPFCKLAFNLPLASQFNLQFYWTIQSFLRVSASPVHTNMHLSSFPYLEPSKLLLYPLNFLPLLYSTMPILHSTLQYFSQLFSLRLNYQGSPLIPSSTSKVYSHFTTHLSSHDSFVYTTKYFLYSALQYLSISFLQIELLGIFYALLYQAEITHLISLSIPVLFKVSHLSWLLYLSQY